MTDQKIIELYFSRDESAIKYTEEKYGKYCKKIAENVLGDSEDSKECVNDTWFKVWQAIPPLRPDNFKVFLAKIARNLAINKYKSKTSIKRGGSNMDDIYEEIALCIPDASKNIESEYLEKELSSIISDFLKKQPVQRSNFFVRRYFFNETMEEIAKRYKVSTGNVMTSLSRTRKELKKYLESEGYVC
ncbi:MAG: sigma-70 family RNA polymerase sigma factor [Lachnospiraceae bacterium]|nr:sigma-70 family RNA polymerase sigma factor [Lachnospiraceae bacterium]